MNLEALAKFWIQPKVCLAESYGFNSKELKEMEELVKNNEQEIKTKWNEYFCE